jgi:hypothetical protein
VPEEPLLSLMAGRIYIRLKGRTRVGHPGGKPVSTAIFSPQQESDPLVSAQLRDNVLQRLRRTLFHRRWLTDVRSELTDSTCLSLTYAEVNEARALRVVEIMNDFRTIQLHISSHISRAQANPPDQQAYYADGQAILATHFNQGSLGLAGGISESEVQKATLQRQIYAFILSRRC